MSKYKIALGITAVAAAGVLAGLLIAPQKGAKLRKKMRRTSEKWISCFSEKLNRSSHEPEDVEENSHSVSIG